MAKVRPLIHGFNAGEVSNAALARVDQARLRLAAETQENLLPYVIGKGQMRPGTLYLCNTSDDNRCRLVPFIKSVSETAVLELSDGALRIIVDDVPLTRASVTSTVTNGDFSDATGWTLTVSGGATSTISGGVLTMVAVARGGSALAERSVTTSSAGTEHALHIVVTRGPVRFRCGSSSGADDYISETVLDAGEHSLAFTPSGTYYVRLFTRLQRECIVDSIQVESAGVVGFDAPWSESELREIRYDQSADIVFLAHRNWQQRKIERRGNTSWSLVLYQTDDGPTTVGRTANTRIRLNQTYGNPTLTSEDSFFSEDMIGSVFRIQHERYNATWKLGAEDRYTDTWQVNGVTTGTTDDRDFTIVRAGTWSGTLALQRSTTGPDSGFATYTPATYTGNGSNVISDGDDNLIAWYRMGFRTGEYTSGSITVSAGYDGDGGYGYARITGVASSTSASAEMLRNTVANHYTESWEEGEWSDKRGWPDAVAFFDGRLWWGRGDKFWGSASDNYYTFNRDDDGDDQSVQRNVATGGSVNSIVWMMALQRLLIGTDGSESSVRSSSIDQPLTPTATTVKDASTRGSAKVSPVKVDGRGIFLQRSGTRLYEILYSVESNDYVTRHLTRLNEEIGGDGLVELAVQREPQTYIWAVRSDGQAVCCLYDIAEEVQGFFRIVTDGEIESVCVLPGTGQDIVYLAIKRTIDGNTVRYVEKMAKVSEAIGGTINKIADSAVYAAGPVSSVTAAHLANETGLVGWGTTGGAQVALTGLSANGSGVISLGATYTDVWVGLSYDWKYKSSKLGYGAGDGGTPILQKKRVGQIGLLMENTHRAGITYGPDFDTLDPMPEIEDGTDASDSVYTTYDETIFPYDGNWDTDSRVCLKGSAPYPVTLLGLVMEVETNET